MNNQAQVVSLQDENVDDGVVRNQLGVEDESSGEVTIRLSVFRVATSKKFL